MCGFQGCRAGHFFTAIIYRVFGYFFQEHTSVYKNKIPNSTGHGRKCQFTWKVDTSEYDNNSTIVGAFCGFPLDTVKVRLQTGSNRQGAIKCFMEIVRKESPMGLFKGWKEMDTKHTLNVFRPFYIHNWINRVYHIYDSIQRHILFI